MKFIGILFAIITAAYGRLPVTITPRDGVVPAKPITGGEPSICGTLIAACGDVRAILGPQGKNIAVCQHGDAIAVIFGAATGDPNYPMCLKIAYSTNSGTTWNITGPWSGNVQRLYPGCDGTPNFCTNPGECIYIFQLHGLNVMIEENVPSNPWPSVPMTLPHSDSISPWLPGICFATDNPLQVLATARCYLPNGNYYLYSWYSQNGGYNWSDTINMGVQINPNYGGNCAPVICQGSGGYAGGIYINSVGGITNDGWPHFIESTDGGHSWLSPVTLPVPTFDSAAGMFWWHEIEAEVINNKPWVLANDFSGGFWIFKGNGTPGNHTWQIYDAKVLGACSLYVGDTLFQMAPSQYGSICHDPVSGMTLITYKAYGYIVQGGTNVLQDGPCVGGVYTYDDGLHWSVARPLSAYTISIPWGDWGATETAHRLANIQDTIYSYTIWIDNTTFDLYFERGKVQPILMNIAETDSSKPHIPMKLTPTISRGTFRIEFTTVTPGIANLALFDVAGRQVANLFKGRITAGPHTVIADISHLPVGTYFIRLRSVAGSAMDKILLIR
jgi:hypothetical protein